MGDYEDRADIIDVTHSYCWALDRNQWDELDDVFLSDATAVLGTRSAESRDEIKQICSSALTKLDDSQHIVATHQVRVDGDTATCRCYLHAQHIRLEAEGGWAGASSKSLCVSLSLPPIHPSTQTATVSWIFNREVAG